MAVIYGYRYHSVATSLTLTLQQQSVSECRPALVVCLPKRKRPARHLWVPSHRFFTCISRPLGFRATTSPERHVARRDEAQSEGSPARSLGLKCSVTAWRACHSHMVCICCNDQGRKSEESEVGLVRPCLNGPKCFCICFGKLPLEI